MIKYFKKIKNKLNKNRAIKKADVVKLGIELDSDLKCDILIKKEEINKHKDTVDLDISLYIDEKRVSYMSNITYNIEENMYILAINDILNQTRSIYNKLIIARNAKDKVKDHTFK